MSASWGPWGPWGLDHHGQGVPRTMATAPVETQGPVLSWCKRDTEARRLGLQHQLTGSQTCLRGPTARCSLTGRVGKWLLFSESICIVDTAAQPMMGAVKPLERKALSFPGVSCRATRGGTEGQWDGHPCAHRLPIGRGGRSEGSRQRCKYCPSGESRGWCRPDPSGEQGWSKKASTAPLPQSQSQDRGAWNGDWSQGRVPWGPELRAGHRGRGAGLKSGPLSICQPRGKATAAPALSHMAWGHGARSSPAQPTEKHNISWVEREIERSKIGQ